VTARIRCFLAINFPLGVTRRIAEEIEQLRGPVAQAGWRVAWVPAANLHLTLKFFGSIAEPSVEGIHVRLRRELSSPGRAPFEIEARGLGAFPDPGGAKVLWAGVHGGAALTDLREGVERWMEETGFPREARKFHPHVTIGRVKQPGAQPLAQLIAAREAVSFGQARATEVVIYESRTEAGAAEYRALGRIPIGGSEGSKR
jgi:2'-5' RNA ligase